MNRLLKEISTSAINLSEEQFGEKEKLAQWIGFPPATVEAIEAAQIRLGVKLPADVIAFYKETNGTAEILSHCFSGFDTIEKIDWLKNAIPYILTDYAEMGEDYGNDLSNSIVIAGTNHVHQILIIQPYGQHKNWRYWEFAHYIPGESEFKGIENYLERINDFLKEQIKNRNEASSENLVFIK